MDWLTGARRANPKRLLAVLSDPVRREGAAQELIRLGGESVPPLLEALQTEDPELLAVYQEVLARIPASSPVLIAALENAEPLIRGRVAEVIGLIGDRSALPALLEAVKSEYFTVRSRVAMVLSLMGDPQAIPALLPLLEDPEMEVRIAACLALGKFCEPSTTEEISKVLLDDPKIETRQAAARALQAAGHPGAIPYLMEALRDPFWWYERDGAVQDLLSAIESMGEAVVDPLVEALSDKEGTVRRLAATILGNLKSPRAMDHLGTLVYDLHHDVSRAAAIALGKYGLPAFELLMDSLRHAESGIREHAVLGLGYIRSEPVASLLVACLSDPERGVRRQAVLSMAELKDPRTLPALHEIAASRTDRELAALAKETIARIQAAGNQPIPR